MPALSKPGVDWAACQADFAAGQSFGWLSKRHGVSRQAVSQRATREGWSRTPDGAAYAASKTAKRIYGPTTSADHRLVAQGGRSALAAQRVLDALRLGAPRSTAAKLIGVTPTALRNWADDDATFERAMAAAEADFSLRIVGNLSAAADRGDVGASKFLAERHPAMAGEFGPKVPEGGGGAGISISLVLPESAARQLMPAGGTTIEHSED